MSGAQQAVCEPMGWQTKPTQEVSGKQVDGQGTGAEVTGALLGRAQFS